MAFIYKLERKNNILTIHNVHTFQICRYYLFPFIENKMKNYPVKITDVSVQTVMNICSGKGWEGKRMKNMQNNHNIHVLWKLTKRGSSKSTNDTEANAIRPLVSHPYFSFKKLNEGGNVVLRV